MLKKKFLAQNFAKKKKLFYSKNFHFFQASGQLSGYQLVQRLLKFVWPKDKPEIKRRVLVALCLLIAAKLANVSVPFLLRDIVNYYNGKAPEFLKLTFDGTPSQTIFTAGIATCIACEFFKIIKILCRNYRY